MLRRNNQQNQTQYLEYLREEKEKFEKLELQRINLDSSQTHQISKMKTAIQMKEEKIKKLEDENIEVREIMARCDSLINSQTTILNEFQQEISYLKQSKPSSLI